jgi:mono/diheme cytochrome c family protein
MNAFRFLAAAAALTAAAAAAQAQPGSPEAGDPARGELLYGTACNACHTTQPHWRDRRVARSWPELLDQVERWRRAAGQSWSAEDVVDVGAYLNERFYRFECGGPDCRGTRPGTRPRD